MQDTSSWSLMHFYDLRHNTDQDDLELGIRVASALYLENVNQESFLFVLNHRHRWVSDMKNREL